MEQEILERARKMEIIQKAILEIFLKYDFDKHMAYLSLKLLTEKMEEDFPELKQTFDMMRR